MILTTDCNEIHLPRDVRMFQFGSTGDVDFNDPSRSIRVDLNSF